MRFLKNNYGLFIVLILSFWAIQPFFVSGFFPMHDNTQVARVFEMGKMLGEGIFPVRWVPDLGYGYGYPIFNFYAPLAYYVGGAFMPLGFDALVATKIMMVLGVLLAGIFMYFLAREFFGELGGVISGLFYLYTPYHAVDIYVRGDVAEFWAYAFIPLAFLGIYKRDILIGSIGFAAIILSHNLTAMMITPFLLIVILLNCFAYQKSKLFTIHNSLFMILLGLAVSAFYWVPALLELKSTNVFSQIGGGADFRDHFVCLNQLWSSPWGFGGSAKGCIDGMSFMIGKLNIITSVAALALAIFTMRNKNYNNYKYYTFLSFAGFILAVFFTLGLSKSIWQAIPTMAFFQYPWRFLILSSFFSSLLSGALIWFIAIHLEGVLRTPTPVEQANSLCSVPSRWVVGIGFVILVFFLLFFNLKFFVPQTIFPAKASDFTNETALKWVASKISDEYLPPNFNKPESENDIAKNPIPFKETTLERVSNAISFIGVLALIIGIIFKYAKTKR